MSILAGLVESMYRDAPPRSNNPYWVRLQTPSLTRTRQRRQVEGEPVGLDLGRLHRRRDSPAECCTDSIVGRLRPLTAVSVENLSQPRGTMFEISREMVVVLYERQRTRRYRGELWLVLVIESGGYFTVP